MPVRSRRLTAVPDQPCRGRRRPAPGPPPGCGPGARPLERLGVDLVDVLGAGRAGGEPAVLGDHLEAADRRAVAGRGVSVAVIGSPASSVAVTCSGESFASTAFCSRVAGRVDPGVRGLAEPRGQVGVVLARACARCVAMISEASRQSRMPSLSVVQVLPSRRRNDAPALSSPPKPTAAVEQARHEPLEADRHLEQRPAQVGGDPVDHRGGDQRLADRGARAQSARVPEQVGRSPPPGSGWGSSGRASGVTMPCRSASASLPVASW